MAKELFSYHVSTASSEYMIHIEDERDDLPHTSCIPGRYIISMVEMDKEDIIIAEYSAGSLHKAFEKVAQIMKEAGL